MYDIADFDRVFTVTASPSPVAKESAASHFVPAQAAPSYCCRDELGTTLELTGTSLGISSIAFELAPLKISGNVFAPGLG